MRASKLRLPESTDADDEVALGRRPPRSARAAGRSSRCTSCSRSRPCGSRAARGTASGRRARSTRSRPSSRARGSTSPTACALRPRSTAFFASRPAPSITGGFDVFVQLVIAAITTAPCSSSKSVAVQRHRHAAWRAPRLRSPRTGDGRLGVVDAVVRRVPARRSGRSPGTSRRPASSWPSPYSTPKLSSASRNDFFASRERHAVLRPARAGEARLDVAEVELDDLRVASARASGSCQSRFSLQYASTSAIRSALRPVRRRYSSVTLVDREEAARRAVLGRHVPDRRAVGERQRRRARGRSTRRTSRRRRSGAGSR